MKIDRKNRGFDDVIGLNKEIKLTKGEHDQVREYRRKLYEERSNEDKINDILTGFRFSLKNYVENENLDNVILLGNFLNKLLKKINIKKGVFAEYIDISPRNINKYFNGERKFSIDHALKLEKLFDVQAKILLEIQLKNEIIETKRSHKGAYDKFNINDLLVF
jgi:plasmid maintenance system antidote protein VapI